MLGKIKRFLFPCEGKIQSLWKDHSEAVHLNVAAHDALMKACRVGVKNSGKGDLLCQRQLGK